MSPQHTEVSTVSSEEKVRFLSSGEAYGLSDPVELIETHMAWVFLAGQHVFKLKKPVKYPYLDFSSLRSREAVCREELRLNRQLARETYLDVVPLTRNKGGSLSIGGSGATIDWLIKMRRLPANLMLDHLVKCGTVTERDVDTVSDVLFSFYGNAINTPLAAEEYLRVFREEHEKNREILLQVDHNMPRRESRSHLRRSSAL